MEAGLGASRCSWDGLGVPPRSLVIHEASLEIERHNEALPRVAVAASIVCQLLQRIRSLIRSRDQDRRSTSAVGSTLTPSMRKTMDNGRECKNLWTPIREHDSMGVARVRDRRNGKKMGLEMQRRQRSDGSHLLTCPTSDCGVD
jgi:hypothetical protein